MNNLTYLVDICDFQGGTQPPKKQWSKFLKDGYIRMLQIRDFTQFEKVEPEYVKYSTKLKTCKSDDILIARYGASLGKILTGLSGAYNVAIMKTIPNENKITKKYLYYYFLSDSFQNTIKNFGSRAAQAGFNKEDLSLIKLKCPSIEKQEEQCLVLNYIYNLIDKRRRQILLLDKLVKSRFIEMFGTFPENSKNWTICTIKEIVSDVRYGTSRAAVDGGKYPYLRMNNITYDGELDLTDLKYIDIPDKELEKCTVKCGDVLFNRTNSKELVGKTCVYNRNDTMVLAGFIIRIRVNENILPVFLAMFLNMDFSKTMLKEMCKSAIGQANINATELQKIRIILPPIELQEEFVEFKNQTDKSKFVNYKCLQTVANIYRQEWMRCQTSNF